MQMRKTIATIVSAAALAATLASPLAAQEVTLRYSNWLPAGLVFNKDIMVPWIAEVEKVTEGRVKVAATPKVVATVPGQYDVVVDGLADLSFFLPGYQPGRWPAVDGLELPLLSDDPHVRCEGMWKAYEDHLAKAEIFKEVKVLGLFCASAGQIALANTTIGSADALKGKKVRAANTSTAKALELLGATPVTKPASEIYELASGGIIDGAIIPLDSILDFKLDGVLKKVGEIPGGMVSTVVMVPINKDAWAKISGKDQQAILAISGATMAKRAGDALAAATDQARNKLIEAGVEVYKIEPAAAEQMTRAMQPLRDAWIETARQNGLADPAAMLSLFDR